MEFRFQDWKSRQDHPGLRDAWLATQELAARRLDGRVADCILCGRPTVLRLAGATDPPDLREQLVCTRCGLNTRLRAALHLLRGQLRGRVPAPRPRRRFRAGCCPASAWARIRPACGST